MKTMTPTSPAPQISLMADDPEVLRARAGGRTVNAPSYQHSALTAAFNGAPCHGIDEQVAKAE
jgi:hypothetical protein